jgi:hypothetical protein
MAGELGPKRKQGDNQTPEGFYAISYFNPRSDFHLSLHIDYPNRRDRAAGADGVKLGGDIFIHGGCLSEGCLAITDEGIRELYWLAVEARSVGQRRIPVHIFPARLGDGGPGAAAERVQHAAGAGSVLGDAEGRLRLFRGAPPHSSDRGERQRRVRGHRRGRRPVRPHGRAVSRSLRPRRRNRAMPAPHGRRWARRWAAATDGEPAPRCTALEPDGTRAAPIPAPPSRIVPAQRRIW